MTAVAGGGTAVVAVGVAEDTGVAAATGGAGRKEEEVVVEDHSLHRDDCGCSLAGYYCYWHCSDGGRKRVWWKKKCRI